MPAPEILLVEPDDILAALLLEALAEDGYRVERATTHDEALTLCAARGQAGYRLLITPSASASGAHCNDQFEFLCRRMGAPVLARAPWQGRRQAAEDATTLREPFTLDGLLNAVSALLRASGAYDGAWDMEQAPDTAENPVVTYGETRAADVFTVISGSETSEMDPFEASYLRARAALDQLDAALLEFGVTGGDAMAEQGLVLAALRDGAFLLCPPACPREGCAVALFELRQRDYIRVCYGAEQGELEVIAAGARMGMNCPHCGVRPGQWHHVGCFFEMCPLCGESLLDGCHGDHTVPDTQAATREAHAVTREATDLALLTRGPRQSDPLRLASRLRIISPHIRHVHEQTGVNVGSSVHALMTATSTLQMRETLHHVDRAELQALRLLYRMLR